MAKDRQVTKDKQHGATKVKVDDDDDDDDDHPEIMQNEDNGPASTVSSVSPLSPSSFSSWIVRKGRGKKLTKGTKAAIEHYGQGLHHKDRTRNSAEDTEKLTATVEEEEERKPTFRETRMAAEEEEEEDKSAITFSNSPGAHHVGGSNLSMNDNTSILTTRQQRSQNNQNITASSYPNDNNNTIDNNDEGRLEESAATAIISAHIVDEDELEQMRTAARTDAEQQVRREILQNVATAQVVSQKDSCSKRYGWYISIALLLSLGVVIGLSVGLTTIDSSGPSETSSSSSSSSPPAEDNNFLGSPLPIVPDSSEPTQVISTSPTTSPKPTSSPTISFEPTITPAPTATACEMNITIECEDPSWTEESCDYQLPYDSIGCYDDPYQFTFQYNGCSCAQYYNQMYSPDNPKCADTSFEYCQDLFFDKEWHMQTMQNGPVFLLATSSDDPNIVLASTFVNAGDTLILSTGNETQELPEQINITIFENSDTANATILQSINNVWPNFYDGCGISSWGSIWWECNETESSSHEMIVQYNGCSCGHTFDANDPLSCGSWSYICEDYRMKEGSDFVPAIVEHNKEEVYYVVTSDYNTELIFGSGWLIPGQTFTIFAEQETNGTYIPFPDLLNITIFESDAPGSTILQSLRIRSRCNSESGYIFLPYEVGSIHIAEIRNEEQGILDGNQLIEDLALITSVNLLIFITPNERVKMTQLVAIINTEIEAINLTDKVADVPLIGGSTLAVQLGPIPVDLSNRVRYTVFTTGVASNQRGRECNAFAFFEFILGVGL